MRKEFYGYTASFDDGIPAASQVTVNIAIDKDSNFEFIKGTRVVMTDLSDTNTVDQIMGQQFPALRCWVYDTGRGAYITDKPVSIVNMFGTAQYPGILAEPLLLLAGSGLNVTIYNDYPAVDMLFAQLTFLGRKVSIR